MTADSREAHHESPSHTARCAAAAVRYLKLGTSAHLHGLDPVLDERVGK